MFAIGIASERSHEELEPHELGARCGIFPVIPAKEEKRAKGLEPSTSSLGSGEGVVLSPSNKRVADCRETAPGRRKLNG